MLAPTLPEKRVFLQHKLKEQKDIKEMEVAGGGEHSLRAIILSFEKKVHFFFLIFIYLFIYGYVGSSFLCEGFLQLWQAGATLHRGARASHYRGASCCGAQAPDTQAQ